VLTRLYGVEEARAEWSHILGSLDQGSAVFSRFDDSNLPRRFTIMDRRTSHVRHRSKYLDVPRPEDRAFVFTCNGRRFGLPARSLKEFIVLQERLRPWRVMRDAVISPAGFATFSVTNRLRFKFAE
jgi:hypothetical protein